MELFTGSWCPVIFLWLFLHTASMISFNLWCGCSEVVFEFERRATYFVRFFDPQWTNIECFSFKPPDYYLHAWTAILSHCILTCVFRGENTTVTEVWTKFTFQWLPHYYDTNELDYVTESPHRFRQGSKPHRNLISCGTCIKGDIARNPVLCWESVIVGMQAIYPTKETWMMRRRAHLAMEGRTPLT